MAGTPEVRVSREGSVVSSPDLETPHRSRVSLLTKLGVGIATGVATLIHPEVAGLNIIYWGTIGCWGGILIPTAFPGFTFGLERHERVSDQLKFLVRSAATGVKVGAIVGATIAAKGLIFG